MNNMPKLSMEETSLRSIFMEGEDIYMSSSRSFLSAVPNDDFHAFPFGEDAEDKMLVGSMLEPRPMAFDPMLLEPRPLGDETLMLMNQEHFIADRAAKPTTSGEDNLSQCIDLVLTQNETAPSVAALQKGGSQQVLLPVAVSFRSEGYHNSKRISDDSHELPLTKRQKTVEVISAADSKMHQFNTRQDVQWLHQYQQLVQFNESFGHCHVPITFPHNQVLARWVKRQRYQHKRMKEGKPSAISKARIQMLEALGFIWDAHAVGWEEKFNVLVAWMKERGHSKLDMSDPKSAQLSTWMKCQRRQYKLLHSGEPSHMTTDRIDALNSIGFVWTKEKTT